MRNLEDLIEDLMNRIEVCSATQDLDFLEDRIWEMRCEVRDAQGDELRVVYDHAIHVLVVMRFKLACDTTP